VGDVLVQRGCWQEEAGQGLWASGILAFSTSSLVALLAPLAMLMGKVGVPGLLLALCVSQAVAFANPVMAAGLKERLRFSDVAVSQLLEGCAYSGAALLFAWLGFGPYSLVLPVLPRALAGLVFFLWRGRRPTLERMRPAKVRAILKPSLTLSLSSVFMGLQAQAPVFLASLLLVPKELGFFSWGWAVASQAVFLLAVNLRNVLMPAIAHMRGDPQRQLSAARRAAKLMTLVLVPACLLQALLAKPIVTHLLPEKWHGAVPCIVFISLGLCLQGGWVSANAYLNATGRYQEMLRLGAVQTLLTGACTFLGAWKGGYLGAVEGAGLGLFLAGLASMIVLATARAHTIAAVE
jgi:PST family polysaccharide transporter